MDPQLFKSYSSSYILVHKFFTTFSAVVKRLAEYEMLIVLCIVYLALFLIMRLSRSATPFCSGSWEAVVVAILLGARIVTVPIYYLALFDWISKGTSPQIFIV